MPTYTFKNETTGEVITDRMSLSEREAFLTNNPDYKQVLSTPSIGDPMRLGVKKTPDSFQDLLRHAKKAHKGSTIQTRH